MDPITVGPPKWAQAACRELALASRLNYAVPGSSQPRIWGFSASQVEMLRVRLSAWAQQAEQLRSQFELGPNLSSYSHLPPQSLR